jgi:hypothetical protein
MSTMLSKYSESGQCFTKPLKDLSTTISNAFVKDLNVCKSYVSWWVSEYVIVGWCQVSNFLAKSLARTATLAINEMMTRSKCFSAVLLHCD